MTNRGLAVSVISVKAARGHLRRKLFPATSRGFDGDDAKFNFVQKEEQQLWSKIVVSGCLNIN